MKEMNTKGQNVHNGMVYILCTVAPEREPPPPPIPHQYVNNAQVTTLR